MKTAEEYVKDIHGYHLDDDTTRIVAESYKEYAKQVAQQVLKDAADKYKGITMKDDYGCVCDVPSAITSTLIITP